MKSGVIFSVDGKETKKVVYVDRIRKILRLLKIGLNRFGKWMIVIGIGITFWMIWPVLREEMKYSFFQTDSGRTVEKIRNTDLTPKIIVTTADKDKPNWTVPDDNFSIYIPKIVAKSVVVENVDPWDKSSYQEALIKGVAAAKDLSAPGRVGTTYLFAHSVGSRVDFARYNAVFYLLHKLEASDEIEVVYKGDLYKYKVWEKIIIDAKDLSYFAPQDIEERLVLQTCYPPGTTWKRLIVVAKRV